MTNRSMQSTLTGSLSSASLSSITTTNTMNPATIAALNSINSTINAIKSSNSSPATNSPKNTPKSDTSSTNNPGSAANPSGGGASSSQQTFSTPQVLVRPSLEIPLLPHEKLYPTPSMNDSLPYDVEFDLRLTGCELIQTAGRLLKLPQTAMATAQVLLHRYYCIKSFVVSKMEHHAMALVYLASKIGECPRRIRDVMNVFNHIKQIRTGKVIQPLQIDENYIETKQQIIKAERRILKELGFCVHVKHPHKIIFIYLQAMELGGQSELSQKAWNYMNDSLRTDIFLRYSQENIVCACIYLSARELQISLPQNPPWFIIFGADEATIKEICVRILHLYSHKTRSLEELEKIVNEYREQMYEAKKRLKEAGNVEAKSDLTKTEPVKVDLSKTGGDASTTAQTTTSTTKADELKPSTTKPGMISHESMPILGHTQSYYPPQHQMPPNIMSRHSSFNYNYYHHSQYMNGNGNIYPYQHHHHPPHHEPYHNENYYDGSLKKNKSASSLIPSSAQLKEADEYHKRHSSKSKSGRSRSRDRSKSYKDEYSKSKISNQTNNFEYNRSKSRSKSRSRSPWKRSKEEKKSSKSHRKHMSRSRSRSMGSVESERSAASRSPSSSSKHKKKKTSHRHKETSREREQERSATAGSGGSEKSKQHHHHHHRHKSSKSSKSRSSRDRDEADPKYVPIYS